MSESMNRRRETGRAALLCWLAVVIVVLAAAGACTSKESARKADGYYQEGLASLWTDQQRSFVAFQKAVQENPNHRDAHYYLGHLYTQQGKYKEAEREFRVVVSIDPEYSEAYTYLGQILALQDRLDEAIRCYEKALSNPLYVTPDLARFHMGRALARRGDYEEAIKAFQDALLVTPPNVPRPAVHLELARTYYRLGEDDKARRELLEVRELDENGDYAQAANALLAKLRP